MSTAAKNEPVISHGKRPSDKTSLPFRAFTDHRGSVWLECWTILPSGHESPYRVQVGDISSPVTNFENPTARRIYDLMQLYYAKEAEVDGLRKERDDLLTRVKVLEGEVRTTESRSESLKNAHGKGKGG